MLAGTVQRGLARARHSHAALLRRGIAVEAERARARGRVIRAAADRVRSAHVLAHARICEIHTAGLSL